MLGQGSPPKLVIVHLVSYGIARDVLLSPKKIE
jgi:hypothetical protein